VIVGYYDGLMCSVADQGYKVALPYWEKAVIVEEIDDGSGTVAVPSDPTDSAQPLGTITNRSRVRSEFAGAGLNCGFAAISGIGVLG
jgi:hypothetical protein